MIPDFPQVQLTAFAGVFFALSSCGGSSSSTQFPGSDKVIVPDDQPTIQAGIAAAGDGSLVLVRPGTYFENINLQGKRITLASWYLETSQELFIDQTIIDGQGNTVITVSGGADNSTIEGFTVRNGLDGISTSVPIHISHNRIIQNIDGIDYEGGGGTCLYNVFFDNSDDGIDLDGPVTVLIDSNTIRDNGDDGIEIRLHPYTGPTLDITISNNLISNNLEDGVQLIDYAGVSNRLVTINRNRIIENTMAGIGLMADGNTVEDFSGAPVPEPIRVLNNTLHGSQYGITGGANLTALNNIISDTEFTAMRNIIDDSIVASSLLWNNGVDYENIVIDLNSMIFSDPQLDTDDQLMIGSPAIDAGVAQFDWNGVRVLDIPPEDFLGLAPDMGAIESR